MLKRLLFSHQRPAQLFVAVFGALIGLLLLLGALQLYLDFHAVLTESSDINQPQYLVINKEVSMLKTLFGGQKGFTEKEIRELKNVEGVRNAAPLTASKFNVAVSMGEGSVEGIPGMYTDLFFESVPDSFIDVSTNTWHWREGDSLVPIIMPRDYIKLYNFGFAPSQNLPQVTESVVGLLRFNIIITTKTERIILHGKLAGFSERINTILAPQSFLDYANEKYAGVKPGTISPSRVIVECNGPATAEVADYFAQNGYETSAEALRNSKLNSFLRVVMYILVGIGIVILVLTLLGFLQYSQLLLSKSSYELETLIRIGHDYKKLAKTYLKYYSIIYAGIFVFSIAALWTFKHFFNPYIAAKGFELPTGLSLPVIICGLCFTLLFLVINAISVFSGLKKLAK